MSSSQSDDARRADSVTAVNRIANNALAIGYAVTIIRGAVGEWSSYIFGRGIEVVSLRPSSTTRAMPCAASETATD
jgi:hypothetical protein